MTIQQLTDQMVGETGRGPFHLNHGVYFWRERDGIHLAIAESSHAEANVLKHFTFDRHSWASAVAVTTIEGETSTTYRLADALIG